MSEVIVITSGKGGVGKTTTTANVGTGLAKEEMCIRDRKRSCEWTSKTRKDTNSDR